MAATAGARSAPIRAISRFHWAVLRWPLTGGEDAVRPELAERAAVAVSLVMAPVGLVARVGVMAAPVG